MVGTSSMAVVAPPVIVTVVGAAPAMKLPESVTVTVTVRFPTGAESAVSVKVAAVPSSTAVPAAMEMLGNATAPSSLVIVPVPSGVVIVALVSPDRVRMTVSFGSSIVSPITVTSMFCVVVPGAKVSVPAVIAV